MSRWGKNIVVPLDSCRENTNRPTMSHSVGTVGKWGKMGFTSTRTYTMSALPAAVAAAAAAVAAASPQKSPASQSEYDLGTASQEPPKPRKFFKTRNTTPPEVIAQIIQQLPRQSHSPPREQQQRYQQQQQPLLQPLEQPLQQPLQQPLLQPQPDSSPAQLMTSSASSGTSSATVIQSSPVKESIKIRLGKGNAAERKKKVTPRKPKHKLNEETVCGEEMGNEGASDLQLQQKLATGGEVVKSSKKRKLNKELKPEAPPSRILSRARKPINYCEDDEEDLTARILKETMPPRQKKSERIVNVQETPPLTPAHRIADESYGACPTPESVVPALTNAQANNGGQSQQPVASRTPEHPPIVLRISKGTSRLVSTDSEEQQTTTTAMVAAATPPAHSHDVGSETSLTTGETTVMGDASALPDNTGHDTGHNNLTAVRTPQSSPSMVASTRHLVDGDQTEINYCTVKISPDKPPKERLKLIIKTDVIRNALAAASRASTGTERVPITTEDRLNASVSMAGDGYSIEYRSDREKIRKSKKHRHMMRHANIDQQQQQQQQQQQFTQPVVDSTHIEFKTPSPHLALGNSNVPQDYLQQQHQQQHQQLVTTGAARAVISPAALSERDFDSQSSVLGSSSSKGNSTPPRVPATVEESCVLYSRGSSVITSDLETSQHSSLVAPPSEIELRLESMMMDGEGGEGGSEQQVANTSSYLETEPMQEDILAVLRGDETTTTSQVETAEPVERKKNGLIQREMMATEDVESRLPNNRIVDSPAGTTVVTTTTTTTTTMVGGGAHRTTRGRNKIQDIGPILDDCNSSAPATRTRQKKVQDNNEEVTTIQRRTSRRIKRSTNDLPDKNNAAIIESSTAMEDKQQPSMAVENTVESVAAAAALNTDTTPDEVDRTARMDENELREESGDGGGGIMLPARRGGGGGGGRPARVSNPNHNSGGLGNINKIAANLSAKAGAAELLKSLKDNNTVETNSGGAVPTTQRSYGRKRKNQQVTQVLQQPTSDLERERCDGGEVMTSPKLAHLELRSNAMETTNNQQMEEEEENNDGGVRSSNSQPQSDAVAATMQSQCTEHNNHHSSALSSSAMDNDSNSMDSNSMASSSPQQIDAATPAAESPPKRDYLFKDKFKRTLTLDATVNNTTTTIVGQTAAMSSQVNSSEGQNATTTNALVVAAAGGEPAVKLVISKKKGSIFKSRVPSEQTELAGSKRHLYRHRWDAEANGDGDATNENDHPSSGLQMSANEMHSNKTNNSSASTKAIEAIYNDFNSDETGSSPVQSMKLSRAMKQNNTNNSNNVATTVTSLSNSGINSDVVAAAATAGTQSLCSTSCGRMDQRNNSNSSNSSNTNNKSKDFYTVVSNVKTAHQIQEIGEYQEMDDDVEYILDALQPHNPLSTRCLSALQLATKCMVPAFRMHVRAHGIVTKFFKALSDANQDLSLGLCTSAIMFILSQEGLNMDLDRDSLELMMNLLESERSVAEPADHVNYERNKQKIRELCEEIKAQGRGTHLNVDAINVGTLAMETLLSLTSKRAGEWFKEELRQLGGLEHIIKTIHECSRSILEMAEMADTAGITWTRAFLDNMQTVERCLRVLENVTQMNEENQRYILLFGDGIAVKTLCSLYKLYGREIVRHPSSEEESIRDGIGAVLREVLTPLMKVLINLTHPFTTSNTLGAEKIGQEQGTIDTCFYVLLQMTNYIPDRCIFDFSILALLLLINLTTYTVSNRKRIMNAQVSIGTHDMMMTNNNRNVQQRQTTTTTTTTTTPSQSAISAILDYFYRCEELARLVEKNTDAFLDNQDKSNKKKQEEVDETVNNLLQKAGHHMEHSLKGSYTAILIGHLITDNDQYESIVRAHLRGNGFKEVVTVLEKFYNFMNLTGSSEASVVGHIKSTKVILDYFKKRDLIYEMDEDNNRQLTLPNEESDRTHDDELLEAEQRGTEFSVAMEGERNHCEDNQSSPRVYKNCNQR